MPGPFCPWGFIDILVAVAAFLATIALASMVLSPWVPTDGESPIWVNHAVNAACGVATALVILTLLHRRYGLWARDAGLTLDRWPVDLALAVVLMLLVIAVWVPMGGFFEWLRQRANAPKEPQVAIRQMLSVKDPVPLAVMLFGALVVAPLWEEFAFRGFLQPYLRRRLGPGAGLVLTAAVFSLIHDPFSRFLRVPVMMLPLALALGFARERTGRLAAPILLHLLTTSLTLIGVFAVGPSAPHTP